MVGDFVLLRSNGLPTYNFAATLDDAGMRITHVIRAEEHLANTPRQLMLYEALRETAPAFAHVPLILNRDRTKMSKRQGEASVAVSDWRREGYLPEALLSYLALLGFHPGDDREILSRAELVEAFSLERVGKSGAVFDPTKLRWVNAHFLHHASGSEIRAWVETAAEAASADQATWVTALRRLTAHLDQGTIERLYELVRGNIATLADLPNEVGALLDAPPEADALEILKSERARETCGALADAIEALAEWNAEAFKSALQSVGGRLGIKGRDLYQPVRVALTGRLHGPELPMIAAVLQRDSCVARLRAAAAGRIHRTGG
jgi:nondiscriminating glutamyl-tRNA synthetase